MNFDEWYVDSDFNPLFYGHLKEAFEAGQKAEREACAAECERMVMYPGGKQEAPAHDSVWYAARAIRERGEKK